MNDGVESLRIQTPLLDVEVIRGVVVIQITSEGPDEVLSRILSNSETVEHDFFAWFPKHFPHLVHLLARIREHEVAGVELHLFQDLFVSITDHVLIIPTIILKVV